MTSRAIIPLLANHDSGERDFDDLKILISHQKAKHFKCERCGRRLNTAGGKSARPAAIRKHALTFAGLSVHMNQVHKETLTSVDNALPNRAGLEYEIFGMEGVPEDIVQAHNQRLITAYYAAEAERRQATGNPGPGAQNGGQSKKPKFESPAELKKRLAEHKARMAEQAAGGGSSGGNTPMENHGQSPAMGQSPGAFVSVVFFQPSMYQCDLQFSQNGSPYAPPAAPFNGGTQGASFGSYSQDQYAQPAAAHSQPYSQQPAYSPPGQYAPPAQYNPQQYPAQPFQAPGFQQPPNFHNGVPPRFGAGSPPGYSGFQPPPAHTPPTPGSLPPRPPSLPAAPGLPQRPSFGLPPNPPYQGPPGSSVPYRGPPQQSGGWSGNGWSAPGQQNPAMSSAHPHSHGYGGDHSANASAVDDLISSATREPDDIDEIIRMAEAGIKPPKKVDSHQSSAQSPQAQTSATPQQTTPAMPERAPEASATPAPEVSEKSEKKSKKKRDENIRMVYHDDETAPEEKLSTMSRYAPAPEEKEDTVLVDATQNPGVAGAVDNDA